MPNHLATETSPYLQQHADNPVNWYPWGEQALTLAREQNKPILLSIGYSACHWCHVMAHESFEDADTAALMNQHFINIKVDREERPDLDHIYQTAHYMLTERNGGWPLTLFLTPDQTPFFGGTYFPPEARHNLPGFKAVMARVDEIYRTRQADIATQNTSLLHAFGNTVPGAPGQVDFSAAPLTQAVVELAQSFDPAYGGFGAAPKFPRPTDMAFLLRQAADTGDAEAQRMALFTLRKMAEGGIVDQLGGGFCRYSVDNHWAIPHFEKMLYDNGPLLALYADAVILDDAPIYRATADGIATWVMREMQSPQGGYYSSLDADSEHEEGRFYVWTPQEVSAVLSAEEYAVAAPYFGLDQPPNFERKHWNLLVNQPLARVVVAQNLTETDVAARLASAHTKLFAAREQRIRPGRDEKILVSWNALMIHGMAHAGRRLNQPAWIASAQRAVDFIHTEMWRNGRLLATYKDGNAHLNAYLDDYAFLLDALLALMEAQFRLADLQFVCELADVLLAQFEDTELGGFYFTSHDHESLIHRPKPGHDNAMPSGNGVAAYALQRLGNLLGESRYLKAAERTLALYYPTMQQHGAGYMTLLMTLQETLAAPRIVILRGVADELASWTDTLVQHDLPHCLVLALADGLTGLPDALNKPLLPGVHAWVCQGGQCLPPVPDLAALLTVQANA